MDPSAVTSVAHLIQLSVAPVFLLAAVAGLLNVFVGRLTRIIDRFDKLELELEEKTKIDSTYAPCSKTLNRKSFLLKRLKTTNYAITFATLAGLMVALVIVAMFLGSIMKFSNSILIVGLFIAAMLFLVLSLILFLREISYTNSFARNHS
jgi:CBS domain containing-hemolysin-like protein